VLSCRDINITSGLNSCQFTLYAGLEFKKYRSHFPDVSTSLAHELCGLMLPEHYRLFDSDSESVGKGQAAMAFFTKHLWGSESLQTSETK
jgi:hypothetical protein